MMLKKIIYDVSDESMVTHWMGNPYLQYFTGEKAFQDLTWNMCRPEKSLPLFFRTW